LLPSFSAPRTLPAAPAGTRSAVDPPAVGIPTADRPHDPSHDADAPPARVRLLVVEDSEVDYELMLHTLRRGGLEPVAVRVEDGAGLIAALAEREHDAVISDHHLPRFSSSEALRLVRASGLPLPFIIVSGTIGEDAAVAAMQAGADDYLIKGRLARLAPALRNAIAAAAARRDRGVAEHALAESERRLRALTGHLHQALEAERAAIAREIHDDVGGMLTALRFDLAWLQRHGDDASRTRAARGQETLNQAVLAVQRILRNLRPPALEAGIVAALDSLVAGFGERTGLELRFGCNRECVDLDESLALVVYRVAQEALTNVAKHSGAQRARVDLVVRSDVLSLEVTDDGRGLAHQDLDKPGSFGLRGLAERARQAGGWLDVAVGEGRGAVLLTLPLTDLAAARLDAGGE
jgi:signal transduction histidine kinase